MSGTFFVDHKVPLTFNRYVLPGRRAALPWRQCFVLIRKRHATSLISASKRLTSTVPIQWPAPSYCDDDVRKLAATILTVPADHRYENADMDRIARAVKATR